MAKQLWVQLKKLGKGDVLYLQFPLLGHSIFQGLLLKYLKREIKIVLIIHDLTMLREIKNTKRLFSKMRLFLEEKSILLCSTQIIVHNDKMKSYLEKMGIDSAKLISLRIFDYIVSDRESFGKEMTENADADIIIAGNLEKEKAGYVYCLPSSASFNLYGPNYEGMQRKNVYYQGAYKGDELPHYLTGRFGLVWDGPSVDTCTGSYGEYLKMNNPHKTSLYLAAGIPVAIWRQAALAQFIRENQCGILIDSLKDLQVKIWEMSEENYVQLKMNAGEVGKKIREGFFLKEAVNDARKRMLG